MPGERANLDSRRLKQWIAKAPTVVDDWLHGVAFDIEGDIKLSFSPNGPSAPGQPPAVDTGRLRASIHTEKLGELHYRVSDGTLYGLFLERGTHKMKRRPFFGPVFIEWQQRKLALAAKRLEGLLGSIR